MAQYRYTGESDAYFPDYGKWMATGDVVDVESAPESPWFEAVTSSGKSSKTTTSASTSDSTSTDQPKEQ